MPEPMRLLLVGQSPDELLALRAVATRLVNADAELFTMQVGSESNDPELAWGRKRLEVRRLDADAESLGPAAHELSSLDGEVWKAVADAVRRHRVGVVVIASHQQRWLRRVLKGSLASDVVEHSGVPVLAVPDAALVGGVGDRA